MSMTRAEVNGLLNVNIVDAEYVIKHAARQQQRGRKPSVAYRCVTNPRAAFLLARSDRVNSPPVDFSPRPIGINWLACFACGANESGASTQPDMSAFVSDKEAGERVVDMFAAQGSGATLDYRPCEPGYVQVKVGACEQHVPNLEVLQGAAIEAGLKITPAIITAALTVA